MTLIVVEGIEVSLMDVATFLNLIFGGVGVASFLFALYTYFKSREYIYSLIEKLRASRNQFIQIGHVSDRIQLLASSDVQGLKPQQKIGQMRELAATIGENVHRYMNTIDDGVDWGELSAAAIFKKLK